LSALGSLCDEPHDELHQLFGRPSRRLVKLLYHRFLFFFLLAHVLQLLGGPRRRALGHPPLEIGGGKCPGSRGGCLRRAAIG
jgi:hypothetical protein